ncbi:hypothetical protein GCM10023318_25830 [Nocardia callitridis]|uniref:Uncharacterized protein n=1 Tax=Nocardia callitridis TaxID=648753 RepID=A0ABP9K7A8_9NOCA
MSRVDDRVDAVVRQPLSETGRTTESADAHLPTGQRRVANATGERGDDVESSLAGSELGKVPGFAGTAQNQNPQGWPLK